MGDQDDGVAGTVQALEDRHDLDAGLRVEIAGRLVREQDGRIVDERPRNRHPLPLSPGELVRPVGHPVVELDQVQRGRRRKFAAGRRHTGVDQGQLHVVKRRRPGQQVEGLKDETDLLVPDERQLVVVHDTDILSVQPIRTAGGRVETADEVHQRRLAGAGGPHDGDELAALDVDRDTLQRVDRFVAHSIGLPDFVGVDKQHRSQSPCARLSGLNARYSQ